MATPQKGSINLGRHGNSGMNRAGNQAQSESS